MKPKKETNVKLTIILSDSSLDREDLDRATRNLLKEMKQLDEVERVSFVKVEKKPESSKELEKKGLGEVLGMLQAEVTVENILKVLGVIGDRRKGQNIEMELEADGKKLKLKVKARNRQDFLAAIQAAQVFVGELGR